MPLEDVDVFILNKVNHHRCDFWYVKQIHKPLSLALRSTIIHGGPSVVLTFKEGNDTSWLIIKERQATKSPDLSSICCQ